jgi:circadian clock protein KaiB
MSRRATDAEGSAARDYVLRLFVTGQTEKSARAVRNVTKLCQSHLQGRYDLEVVDLYQQPELAAQHQLVAAPTLIKMLPLPPRKMVGDMSDSTRVLAGLGIAARG